MRDEADRERSAGPGSARREFLIIGYSVGNLGKNIVASSIDVTLLFMLTDLIRLPPASVSGLMTLVLVGDLVFDLAAGYVSTWSQRHGVGYRTIIALGVIPCGLAFAFLYSLPMLGLTTFTVVAATLLTFRATYALVDVPHNSLLGRVASDSRTRGRASGYRLLFSTLASLFIALVVAPSVIDTERHGAVTTIAFVGSFCAATFCLSLWIAAWASRPEHRSTTAAPSRVIALFPKPDRLLAAMAVIGFVIGFAVPVFSRMMIYQATYVFGRPEAAGPLLFALTIGHLPGFVLWTYLVRRAEKTRLLALSSALAIVGLVLFATVGTHPMLLTITAVLIGTGLSGVYMLPWAILADVIDFAEVRHRARREAATIATFLAILKASGAASVGSVGRWVIWAIQLAPISPPA